jgi:MYXO-CTERM domain-containing protein
MGNGGASSSGGTGAAADNGVAGDGTAGVTDGESAGSTATDAGSGPVAQPTEVSDCSCRVAGGSSSASTSKAWLLLGLLGALFRRRKPERRSCPERAP